MQECRQARRWKRGGRREDEGEEEDVSVTP